MAHQSVKQSVDAVVVGAGFGGIYMVHRLREAGFTVQGIETAGGVGGTWYWNRYPGARCDIPSLLYSYSWSDDLIDNWRWSEKYAPQPEILAYANFVADRLNIRDHFKFNTRVAHAIYNEVTKRWDVTTDSGEVFDAQYCIMATGCLSAPRDPDFDGAANFKGESYITGRWPHEKVDFTGKRVAMIGTGSSGIQSMPLIAAEAAQVTVFQRTPNYSLPALNGPIPEEERAAFREGLPVYREMLAAGDPGFPLPPEGWVPTDEELAALTEGLWNGGGLVSLTVIPNLIRDEYINEAAGQFVRNKIAEIVKDPKVAEKLTPREFPFATKRACVDTDYYASYNRDNVSLIDLRETPIEAITETGIKTSAGEMPFDAIVYATGFDAMTGALVRIDIRGRNGITLKDAWEHGPKTYLGLTVADFPNFFTITGPGSPSVLTNMMTSIEQHVEWIMNTITHVRDRQLHVIEATHEAQEKWVAHVNEEADKTLFPRANSWYLGANVPGKPRVFMPYVSQDYKQLIDEAVADDYRGFAMSA